MTENGKDPLENGGDLDNLGENEPDPNFNLSEAIQSELETGEMKRHIRREKRKEKREQIKKKLAELNAKTTEVIDNQFAKIFDSKVRVYTGIFVLFCVLIGLFAILGQINQTTFLGKTEIVNFNQFMVITLAIMLFFAYMALYALSRKDRFHKFIFESKKGIQVAIMGTLIGLCLGVEVIYWNTIDKTLAIDLPFLDFQQLFSLLLALIFFGWNGIQIIFLRQSIEKRAITQEAKFRIKNADIGTPKARRSSMIRNIIFLSLPYVLHISFVLFFFFLDTPTLYEWLGMADPSSMSHRFVPDPYRYNDWVNTLAPGDPNRFIPDYISEVWFSNSSTIAFLIWVFSVFVLMIYSTIHQIRLLKQSAAHNTPNIFSSAFYLFFWLFFYLKLYSLLNTLVTEFGVTDPENQASDFRLVFDWILNVALMALTIINLTGGFGRRLRKGMGERKLSDYTLVLLMFMFVATYWGGQWSLIASGFSKATLSIATGFLVIAIYFGYYIWYSRWVMERRGYTRKRNYTRVETKDLLVNLSQKMSEKLLRTRENQQIITETLNSFLLEEQIALKEGTDEDAVVESLEQQEKDMDSETRAKWADDQLAEARKYEFLVQKSENRLEVVRQELVTMKKKKTQLESELKSADSRLPDIIAAESKKIENFENILEEMTEEKRKLEKKFTKMSPPKLPEKRYTKTGEEDVEVNQVLEEHYTADKAAYDQFLEEMKSSRIKYEENAQKLADMKLNLGKRKDKLARQISADHEYTILTQSITEFEKELHGLEADVIMYREEREYSKPVISSAEKMRSKVSEELDCHQELDEARRAQELADSTLQKANTIFEKWEADVQQLSSTLADIPELSQIDADIVENEKLQTELGENLESQEGNAKNLADNYQLAVEKYENAKKQAKEADSILTDAEKAVKKAEKEAEELRHRIESNNSLLSEIESLKNEIDATENSLKGLDGEALVKGKVDALRDQLKNLQDRLKIARKSDSPDENQISDLEIAVNEKKAEFDSEKDLLTQIQDLQSKLKSAKGRLDALKSKCRSPADLENELGEAENRVQSLTDALVEPKEAADNAHQKLDEAKLSVKAQETDRKSADRELSELQGEKTAKKTELERLRKLKETRIDIETKLQNARKELKEAGILVKRAQKEADSKKTITATAQEKFDGYRESSSRSMELFRAERSLHSAHRTLKEAIRSAEANVKYWEEKVKEIKSQIAEPFYP